jgi:hypothetical protein
MFLDGAYKFQQSVFQIETYSHHFLLKIKTKTMYDQGFLQFAKIQ